MVMCAGIDHRYPALIEIIRKSRPVFSLVVIRLFFKNIKYQCRPNERHKNRKPGVYSLLLFSEKCCVAYSDNGIYGKKSMGYK
ncbi:MAG: hypothetical protein JWQ85_3779 [Mucilaginibacter sp.]|nr:hypothetical protein [Mucilaginibacter sp.]